MARAHAEPSGFILSKERFMCRKRCGSAWLQRGDCEEFPVQPAATVLCLACVSWQRYERVCVFGWVLV